MTEDRLEQQTLGRLADAGNQQLSRRPLNRLTTRPYPRSEPLAWLRQSIASDRPPRP